MRQASNQKGLAAAAAAATCSLASEEKKKKISGAIGRWAAAKAARYRPLVRPASVALARRELGSGGGAMKLACKPLNERGQLAVVVVVVVLGVQVKMSVRVRV